MSNEGVSRRHFIATAGAAAAWAAIPTPLRAQTTANRPIVGSGEHRYECIHDWLTPPSNIKWGDTHGLATDRHGNIYVAHTVGSGSVSSDAILVFDPKGKFMKSWGAEFRGGAHGLDLRREGSEEFLYHCDTRRRLVVKTTLDGKVVWERGAPMESGVYPDAGRFCPTNVAFLPDGHLLVGDGYGSSYIHRYDADGEYWGVVISPGSDAGFVREPHGQWVDTRGAAPKIVVADRGNHRLQEFDLDGKHLGFVTEGMRRPCHIHYNGGLALVPDLDSVVTILDRDNKVVASLGDGQPSGLRDAPREKFIPGKFVHPHAAIWTNKRDILVCEWVPIGRITRLRKVS
ncbi:twin-arginine translocation signal domain-containing protein [bacterium]|nr:MAG: twin-arginine translocation signal domain-containing protein [bacterium]